VVFGNERLTGALLDRLTHHVHILEMNGESYRLKSSKTKRRQTKKTMKTNADNIDPKNRRNHRYLIKAPTDRRKQPRGPNWAPLVSSQYQRSGLLKLRRNGLKSLRR